MALRPKTGMLTTRVDSPSKRPLPTSEETGRAPPKPAPETKESVSETQGSMTFTFFRGDETGDANPDALYNRGESTQLNQAELKEYFDANSSGMLRNAFGSFDNYLAYMTEREQLIQSGDYDVGNWNEATGGLTEDQQMILEGDDLTQYSDSDQDAYTEAYGQRTQEQSAAYDNWVNSEANQALLAKYGVGSTIYNSDGDTFRWNGSAYVKTDKIDQVNLTEYVKAGLDIALSFLGPAATGAFANFLAEQATLGNLGETLQVVTQVFDRFEPSGYSVNQAASVLNDANVIINLAEAVNELEEGEESTEEQINNIASGAIQILQDIEPEPDRPPQEESFEPEEIEQEEQEEPNVIDDELEVQPPTLPVQEETEEQEEESESGDAGATPETQQEVPQEAEVVNIADENTIEDEDSELASTVPAEGGLEAETEEVVSEAPIVDTLFPEYADPVTGVISQESTPLDETADPLDEQQQSESDLSSQINELGTSILGVEREVSDVERSLTEALEAATLNQATELSDAEARLLSEITGIEADILQQMAESEAGLQQELLDVGTNINQVRSDLQSQIQETQQETAESLEQASDERRDLQQSIISVQGDLNQLDESTRQQFEEFGGTVNDLFSDVNVDIEALQEGQISQAEAQEAFESSVTEQFGELGGQVAGIGQGLEGLGEGIAGIGEGLGAGLLGLAAQQQLLPGQIAAATPIQPVEFEKFQKGLTRRKLADPLQIGMFTGGARGV